MFKHKGWTIWSGRITIAIHDGDRRCVVAQSEDELESFLTVLNVIS